MARRTTKRAKVILAVVSMATGLLGQAPASSEPLLPQALRGLAVPPGFGVGTFAVTPGLLPSSLTFGPDGRLYVAALQGLNVGQIIAFEDLGGVGGPGEVVAEDFNQLLGITFGPDGTLYAADNADNKGRIQALKDANDDGVFEARRTVLHNIPNGRHQTNGMTFGPNGQLYLANGNATDDGIECGPEIEPAIPLECPTPEVKPWTGAILRVNPAWQNVDLQAAVRVDEDRAFAADGLDDESVLVSPGYRNIYDVDFWPGDPSMIYTPMNGSDNPASNEPLFRTDVDDTMVVGQDAQGKPILGPVIDDAGFPSCLYGPHSNRFPEPQIEGHEHPEDFNPYDNSNTAVTDKFGACPKDQVIRPLMFFSEGHNGTTGLAFERGDDFPERYDGDLFVGEWGSLWNLNGAKVTGHKVTHVDIDPETGLVERKREFLTGAIPMDVTFGPDGALYVADMQGFVYRVESVMDTPDMATVEITAGQFVPQIVAIPRDTDVLWVNLDTAAHSVKQEARLLLGDPDAGQPVCVEPQVPCAGNINSQGDIPPGKSHKHAFGADDGIYLYGSGTANPAEPTMQGAVIVTPVDR